MTGALTAMLSSLLMATSPAEPLEQAREWLRAGKTSAAFGLLASTWPTFEREGDRAQARYLLGRELIKRGSHAGLSLIHI